MSSTFINGLILPVCDSQYLIFQYAVDLHFIEIRRSYEYQILQNIQWFQFPFFRIRLYIPKHFQKQTLCQGIIFFNKLFVVLA